MQSTFTNFLRILAISAILGVPPARLLAHPPCCSPHLACEHPGYCGHNCDGCPVVDMEQTSTSIQGKVIRVELSDPRGISSVELLTSQGEKAIIFIAPSWYLSDQELDLKVGEPLTVEVVKVQCPRGGYQVALALTTAEGRTLRVRNKQGYPFWLGGHAYGCCRR